MSALAALTPVLTMVLVCWLVVKVNRLQAELDDFNVRRQALERRVINLEFPAP